MGSIFWDPNPRCFVLPIVDWPVLWYGVLFAFGFLVGFVLFVGILRRFLGSKEKAVRIADRLTVYMVIGTVLGARLGHFLFYERPSEYLRDPAQLLRIWEGGLASHGAALGIVIALWVFSRRPAAEHLGLIRLLDFVAMPTAFAGACIRIGNFFNQEILGTPSSLPWAVVFGHPADYSLPVARHPVQIYEAIFYFAVFLLLWRLSFLPRFLMKEGKLIGLFLMLVFGFRFFIEFLKEEQSSFLLESLTMGQFLSIPCVVIGAALYLRKK